MPHEINIALDSPSQGLLEARASKNGTTVEYEAGMALTRELNRVAQDCLRKSPSEGK